MTDVYEVTLRIEAERQSDARDIADACAEAIRRAPLAKRLGVRVLGWGMCAPATEAFWKIVGIV